MGEYRPTHYVLSEDEPGYIYVGLFEREQLMARPEQDAHVQCFRAREAAEPDSHPQEYQFVNCWFSWGGTAEAKLIIET